MTEQYFLEKLYEIVSTYDLEKILDTVLTFSEEEKEQLEKIIKKKKGEK